MLNRFRSLLNWARLDRGNRVRAEQIGRQARRSKLQRSLAVENLENRRVFAVAVLNEISNDPGGSDQPFEYVEIKGTPGATLPAGLYFASIEGDSAAQGIADIVVDLGGKVLGSNGLLVIKAAIGTGHTIPEATTVLANASFELAPVQTVENGTNTFALIFSPTSPLVAATDYDTNSDGVLELPSGASLVDAVGFTDATSALDLTYGSVNLFSGANFMGGATRFPHDNRANTTAAWYGGDLPGTNTSTAYSAIAANLTANFPAGGALTPGDVNVPGDPNIAPVAFGDSYQVAPSGTLTINSGAGVLSNDTDANGVSSVLSAVLVTGPTNASSFSLKDDGSFSYVHNGVGGVDTFTYMATDLNLFSATVTVSINVSISNNLPPVVSVQAGPTPYLENGPALVVAASATVIDSDSTDFGSGALIVDITANSEPNDVLEIRNEGSGAGQIGVSGNVVQFGGIPIGTVQGGDGSNPLRVDLNTNASLAAVQALTRNVSYRTLSDTPSELLRTIRFVAVDGDGGPSLGVSNEAFTTVSVAAVNDAPGMVASRSSLSYASSGTMVTLDGFMIVTDSDSLNFDTGVLTAAISVGASDGDSLGIRSTGTAAGQISVAGNVVSFGGIPIGVLAGGTNGTPLTVTLNASATPEAAKALASTITFATTSNRLAPAPRTVNVSITDGDGGTSNSPAYTIRQSQVRKFGFQEGVDNGQGLYSGAADVQLAENRPDTNLPAGGNPLTEGLLVDFDASTTNPANSQVLMRYDNIFGSSEGQIPLGSTIVAARLVVTTLNPGDGGTLHRMLTGWDANTETWNTFGSGNAPRNATAGVQNNDIEARAAFDSQIGNAAGNSDPSLNPTIIGVTSDVQAWSNGATNFGWLIQGWAGFPDGWAFLASESANLAVRPKLEVDWLPASIAGASFRQGENGYTGTVDAVLAEAIPTVNNSASLTMSVDFNDVGGTNNSEVLMRFDNINGSVAGQVPAGALVHAASLSLAAVGGNAQGDGGQFHRLLQPFDAATVTWDTFGVGAPGVGGGVNPDGIEASATANTVAGNATLSPNAEAGYNNFDVTQDVQAWTNGTANHGWAILPWANGSDGWVFSSSDATDAVNRPQLRVFYTPVGVTVTPLSGLTTTELGGSANFSLVLNTPPTADVTIGLSSDDTTEGTLTTSSVTFTPANWDIPQVITVTGASDAIADGNIAYQILTAAAVSTDLNYSGLNASDVSITNTDNTTGGAAPRVESIVFGDGTAQRSMVKQITVNFDSIVTVDPNAFKLAQGGAAGFTDVPLSDLTITVNSNNTSGKTVSILTFSSPSPSLFIQGGSLPDGNFRLTINSSSVSNAGGTLDGDNNGSTGGDYVKGAEQADAFFRRFGDSNGNRTTALAELGQLRLAVNKSSPDPAYDPRFDANSNGVVSLAELGQLRQRINVPLSF